MAKSGDAHPSDDLLKLYDVVPTVNRNRLHYPVLNGLPGLSTLVLIQHVLQAFSGCCTVAELMDSAGCERSPLFHLVLVLHRDLWLSVVVRDLAVCSAVVSLRQDALDAVALSHPRPDLQPRRSVHAAEQLWRDCLHYSHEASLAPTATWLHWEALRPRYHSWWVRQLLAGNGDL